MGDIESESKFFWRLILHILLTPITLILIIFRKKEFKDLFQPIYDIIRFIFEPKFTISIIILTILTSVYAWFFLPNETFDILLNYPQDLLDYSRWFSLFSSAFIHADFWHLFGNMLGIFIFGRVVERRFGIGKTMLIYFGAMFISNSGDSAMRLAFGAESGSLGASGALMGLVAAAILINPFYITYELLIPLPIMVVGWIAIYSDLSGILNPTDDGIGHFAHMFGYLSIAIIMFLLGREEKSKLRKGFIINLISLGIVGAIYFLIASGYISIS